MSMLFSFNIDIGSKTLSTNKRLCYIDSAYTKKDFQKSGYSILQINPLEFLLLIEST